MLKKIPGYLHKQNTHLNSVAGHTHTYTPTQCKDGRADTLEHTGNTRAHVCTLPHLHVQSLFSNQQASDFHTEFK
jgi:hypothetical protein